VLLGALRAVRGSLRLSPAVAMAPPAPPLFRRGWLDALGRRGRLRQTTMMILRSVTRWPGRAAVTVFGVAASVSVLIASLFSFDAMGAMVDEVFYQTNRQQVTLSLFQPRPLSAIWTAYSLPGVRRVEGAFAVPVRLVAGPRSRLVSLEARGRDATLVRLFDGTGQPVSPPTQGLTLPESLAEDLSVGLGDSVNVEFLAPPRETAITRVSAVFRQSLGQTAFMSDEALFALMRQSPQVNQLNLLVDDAELAALYQAVKQAPAVSGVTLWSDVRRQFDETMDRNLRRMTVIYSILGILITVGVVYNAARIQLSERAHDLASLRVLGFTRWEVGYVLVGEVMLLTLVGIPLGWLAGYGFAALVTSGFSTDMIQIPLLVSRATYAWASVIAAAAALAAALVVRRRLDHIDIVMALKQRE
jgi:putative ABC transport system permease protein